MVACFVGVAVLLIYRLAFDPLVLIIWNDARAKIGLVCRFGPFRFFIVPIARPIDARKHKGDNCRPFKISHGSPLYWLNVVLGDINHPAALTAKYLVPLCGFR